MLNTRQKFNQSGFTMIELIIGMVMLGILAAIAIPSFQVMMRNTQIRTAAEAVSDGLQRARAEAVSKNTNVELVMGVDSSWTVKLAGVGGTIIESRSSKEGSKDVTVTAVPAGATTITFNNFGSVIANVDGSVSLTQVDFDAVGAERPLRVTVGVGGNARMCDPNLSTGPSAC